MISDVDSLLLEEGGSVFLGVFREHLVGGVLMAALVFEGLVEEHDFEEDHSKSEDVGFGRAVFLTLEDFRGSVAGRHFVLVFDLLIDIDSHSVVDEVKLIVFDN